MGNITTENGRYCQKNRRPVSGIAGRIDCAGWESKRKDRASASGSRLIFPICLSCRFRSAPATRWAVQLRKGGRRFVMSGVKIPVPAFSVSPALREGVSPVVPANHGDRALLADGRTQPANLGFGAGKTGLFAFIPRRIDCLRAGPRAAVARSTASRKSPQLMSLASRLSGGTLQTVIVGDHGEMFRMRVLGDEAFDQVVGFLAAQGKQHADALNRPARVGNAAGPSRHQIPR